MNGIKLPSSDEAVAHMLPSDLKKFETGEHTATAFSISVGCVSGELSKPLFTLEQVREYIQKDREKRDKDFCLCEQALDVEIEHSRRLQERLDKLENKSNGVK